MGVPFSDVPPGVVPPRGSSGPVRGWFEWVLLLTGTLMVLGALTVDVVVGSEVSTLKGRVAELSGQVDSLHAGVQTNRNTGYASRAVSCTVLVALDVKLPDACRDPNVVSLFDADAQPTVGGRSLGLERLRTLVCDVLHNQGTRPADCTGAGP